MRSSADDHDHSSSWSWSTSVNRQLGCASASSEITSSKTPDNLTGTLVGFPDGSAAKGMVFPFFTRFIPG